MRLTTAVKEYIEKRVMQLMPKSPKETCFTAIATAANATAADLSKEVSNLIKHFTDEFVKKYPEAQGVKFEFEYGCRMAPNFCNAEIKTQRDEQLNLKRIITDMVISKVQVMANDCADISELDTTIVETLRDESGLLCPSSCAGHTTTP